jgi:predicted nicotinamide N-methyase
MKNDGESTLIPSSLVTRSKVLRAPFVSSASTATPKSRDVATIASGTDDKGDNTIAIFEHEEREYLEILLLDLPQSLQLRQYNTSHDSWGIYSTVWDGGIALLKYVCDQYSDVWDQMRLLDLGSGTGIVGLGVAACSRGTVATAVTDLTAALPLLRENIARNASHWTGVDAGVHRPSVLDITWGKRMENNDWLQQFLSINDRKKDTTICAGSPPPTSICSNSRRKLQRRVIITGADIVYRPSLFEPLLSTLAELESRVHQVLKGQDPVIEILLSCQSCRSYLDDFWQAARRRGFNAELLAIADLDPADKHNLESCLLYPAEDRTIPVSKQKYPTKEGRVFIVRIYRLPYTFAI